MDSIWIYILPIVALSLHPYTIDTLITMVYHSITIESAISNQIALVLVSLHAYSIAILITQLYHSTGLKSAISNQIFSLLHMADRR